MADNADNIPKGYSRLNGFNIYRSLIVALMIVFVLVT